MRFLVGKTSVISYRRYSWQWFLHTTQCFGAAYLQVSLIFDRKNLPQSQKINSFFRKAFHRSGTEFSTILGQNAQIKKKRKNRTAFTTYQLNELEKRFNFQKYLTPADRDVIAEQLGLTSTQVA